MTTPAICRAVHYVARGDLCGGSSCRAAVITEVHGRTLDPITLDETGPWSVALTVFHPTGWALEDVCVENNDHLPGSWHWPERTPE